MCGRMRAVDTQDGRAIVGKQEASKGSYDQRVLVQPYLGYV